MPVRSVHADELDLFVEACGKPEPRREVKSRVEDMFAAGSMRPEWCSILEDGGPRPRGTLNAAEVREAARCRAAGRFIRKPAHRGG